jgi:hypothetical protein
VGFLILSAQPLFALKDEKQKSKSQKLIFDFPELAKTSLVLFRASVLILLNNSRYHSALESCPFVIATTAGLGIISVSY